MIMSIPVNQIYQETVKHVTLSVKDLKCLSTVIYHEANGEPIAGMRAVAHVVLNRVKSGKFPNNICAVVYQGCQFSWVCNIPKDQHRTNALAKSIAFQELTSPTKDNTNSAMFFHSKQVDPGWSRKKTVVINNHIFYK